MANEIKPTPDFGTAMNTEFISGLATKGEHMVMLLDIDRLLNSNELSRLATTAH
jgi:purine-binding chemotaxis protein CheW